MSPPFDSVSSPGLASTLQVGQAVHVEAGPAWYPATVTSITHTRIGVAYPREAVACFASSVAPWVVRSAEGAPLQPVREDQAGDEVVAFTGARNTIKDVCCCHDGRWVIAYCDEEPVAVPPTAVARLHGSEPSRSHSRRGREGQALA